MYVILVGADNRTVSLIVVHINVVVPLSPFSGCGIGNVRHEQPLNWAVFLQNKEVLKEDILRVEILVLVLLVQILTAKRASVSSSYPVGWPQDILRDLVAGSYSRVASDPIRKHPKRPICNSLLMNLLPYLHIWGLLLTTLVSDFDKTKKTSSDALCLNMPLVLTNHYN